MTTVGQILQKTRLEKKITLEQVESQTKIRQNILSALEEDNFQKLSSLASVKGLLKTYAEFLGLSSERILAIFRRDFDRKERKKVIPQGLVNPLDKPGFSWGPKKTLIFLIVVFFLTISTYLIYQYLSLVRAPFLRVDFPKEGIQITQSTLEISGRADPDSLVTVNSDSVLLSSKGEFNYKIELFSGENKITIEATSKLGKKTKIERTVFYQAKD
jgi:cytoskeletal protein RodZ